jgi:PAS domain S-box-containing protein
LLNLNKTLLEERKMFMQGSVVITRIKADETKKFVYISENVKEVLGYAVEDFTQGHLTYDDLIYPEDIQLHLEERNKAVQNNKNQIPFSPYRMKKNDGSIIWVQDFSTIIQNPDDNSSEILGYFIDITEQKRSEEAIRETNKRYYTLFEEASDAIMLIDEMRIIDCNRNAELLFGFVHEEMLTMDIVMLSPPAQPNQENSLERFNQKLQKSISGETKAFYWQFKNKDNALVDTEIGLSPVVINNKRLFFQAIIRNISQRKKLERSLKESEHKIKALLDAIPDLLFIVDKNEQYLFFKPDSEHKFDVPHEDVIGKKLADFFSGEMYDKFSSSIKQARETNTVVFIEYDLISPMGMRHYEARLTPLENEQVLQVVRDLGPANN